MLDCHCPSHLSVAACAGTPQSTGERSEFLRDRLALFGKVGAFLALSFYLLVNLLFSADGTEGPAQWVTNFANQVNLGVGAAFIGVWLVSRLARFGERGLLSLDAIATVLICTGGALYGWKGGNTELSKCNALLASSHILVTRAVLVPSLASRTLWVSALGMLPTMVPACLAWLQAGPGADLRLLEPQMALFVGWSFIAVASSTIVSRVIYGLRCQVREAQQFGQYKLEEKIGEGGMGEVYRASHAMLRRPTAIKLLRPERAGEENIRRFEREVQLTSLLTHPNTIAIYDFGRSPDGVFYYAMEYLSGMNLDALVRRSGPQPAGRVVHILRQVCASLAEAHGAGLIHRDIKAANIILCERGGMRDIAKVVDFGLVKNLDPQGDVALSAANAITGTPFYLSPEAIRAPGSVDARSDLYAIGVLGYFLLVGKHPFDGGSFVEICSHHLRTPPPKPSSQVEFPIPGDLEQLVLSCLEKDPARRPQTASGLVEALDACSHAHTWSQRDSLAWWSEHAKANGHEPAAATQTATLPSPAGAPVVQH